MTRARIQPHDGSETVNGLRLHYADWGTKGKPYLVLLHGFSAHARYWDGFAVKTRDAFHVIALDQRGHGDSDWAPEYPPEAMPRDLAGFLAALGIDRCTLVGHSMGGGVAIRYAADHPQQVERLVIVDAGVPRADRPANPDNSVSRALAQSEFATEDDAVAHFMRLNPRASEERVRAVIPLWFRRTATGSLTFKFDPALRQGRFAAADPQELMRRAAEMRAAAQRIACPTLLVRGAASDILSREGAEETAALIPSCTVVEVPGAGHNVFTDNLPGFLAAVQPFLGIPV